MRFMMLAALVFFSQTAAAGTAIKDWRVNTEGDYSEAFTSSDSGATLGVLCFKQQGQCVYYLTTPSKCDEGATIPLLVNADAGANQITGTCRILGDQAPKVHALVLSPFDDIESSIRTGANLGIAMPLVEGQFRVYRFSLSGSSLAIDGAKSEASKATGDQTL
ncbi:hypothetical protein [Lysobacter sp. P5_B9]